MPVSTSSAYDRPRQKLKWLLAGAALVQLGIIGLALVSSLRAQRGPVAPPFVGLAAGDTLDRVGAVNEQGQQQQYVFGNRAQRWTLIFAYYSECGACDALAPAWRDWLARDHSALPVDMIGLTKDSLHVAVAYRNEHGWRLPVASVAESGIGSLERTVVARTPWVFLIDPQGVVAYQGHGSSVELIEALVSAQPVGD